MRIRELQDPETGKIWCTRCEGATVLVRAGLPGKEKESAKAQADADTALGWAEKEEWTRLKQGFVLDQPDAGPGAPRMHRYRGRGYTGALPIADVAGQVLSNHYDEARPGDELFLLSETGALTALPELPQQSLVWKACYMPGLHKLLVRANHQILSWTSGAAGFEALTAPNRHPVSCLDTVGTRAIWYAEPSLVVTDLATGRVLLSQEIAPELHGGHSLQMEAALAPDGATAACCARAGEIQFWDVATGQLRAAFLSGDFAMVAGLAYTPDSRFLIVAEQYGHWRNLCFDLGTMAPRPDWIATKPGARTAFALSPDGTRIAIAQTRYLEVFDFATCESQLRFRIDHVVKYCRIAWIGRWLGVQTDYGCASLYAVT